MPSFLFPSSINQFYPEDESVELQNKKNEWSIQFWDKVQNVFSDKTFGTDFIGN